MPKGTKQYAMGGLRRSVSCACGWNVGQKDQRTANTAWRLHSKVCEVLKGATAEQMAELREMSNSKINATNGMRNGWGGCLKEGKALSGEYIMSTQDGDYTAPISIKNMSIDVKRVAMELADAMETRTITEEMIEIAQHVEDEPTVKKSGGK